MKWYRVTDADGTDLGFFSAPSSVSIQTVMQLIQWRFGAGVNVGISGQPPAGTNIINMTFGNTGAWNTGVFSDTGRGAQASAVTPLQTPTAPPYVPPVAGADQPEFGPYTQYLAQIRRGAAEYGPAAGYERGLYDPLRTLYEAEQEFAPVGMAVGGATAGPGEWSSYLQQGRAGVGGQANMYNRASALLAQQMRLTPEERSAYGVSWAPTFSETGDPSYDVSPEMQQAMMQMGTRSAYGARGSQRFARRLPTERDIWLQEQTAGSQEGFLDYLNAKYGLGSFMGG